MCVVVMFAVLGIVSASLRFFSAGVRLRVPVDHAVCYVQNERCSMGWRVLALFLYGTNSAIVRVCVIVVVVV